MTAASVSAMVPNRGRAGLTGWQSLVAIKGDILLEHR